ncbi:L,D-transpeptidase family protein [Flavobacterium agrisoli]|uniref:L,D-transpeptidase family protein n=1 Tax=Flavobacterium agrisoli TaxID=2793066 RepID=A0A934UJU6_9FLAO|nr:L,D-transpeptidase family protein [Flavobacterium agrisoli]MBK0370351.1 L,D-transpeptidase family protein [Flavobacterium agrisoli]
MVFFKRYIILLLLCFGCKKTAPNVVIEKTAIDSSKIPTPQIVKDDERTIPIDTSKLKSFHSQLLWNFYRSSNYETVWSSFKKRQFVLNQIQNSENYGLNASDYNFKKLQNLENNIVKLNDDELIQYDVMLTGSFQKFLNHLYKGKLNPKELYTDWDLKPKDFNVNQVLIDAFNKDDLNKALTESQPKTATYQQLLKALHIINTFPEDKTVRITGVEKIVLNDTTAELIKIKKKLQYWHDLSQQEPLNTIYSWETLDAVKKFQTRHGLHADGVIGKGTIWALNHSKEERRQQIIANLERWRWYNAVLENDYVIVNIPNYSLHVVEQNDTVLNRNVVVGSSNRKTPILSSTLKTIVFNPTWTVPPTIIKEDITAAMKKNRNYTAKKNITILNANGDTVAPANWNENNPLAYRYVQKPGKNNSLGLMKILFPNSHSVYLHDTNHRNLFGRQNRSLSSGCVRIENPLELAQHLLNDETKWSAEIIDSIIVSEKTKAIPITKKYDLFQWYWTAWSHNNQLQFRRDIYNLDAELYRKLRN